MSGEALNPRQFGGYEPPVPSEAHDGAVKPAWMPPEIAHGYLGSRLEGSKPFRARIPFKRHHNRHLN